MTPEVFEDREVEALQAGLPFTKHYTRPKAFENPNRIPVVSHQHSIESELGGCALSEEDCDLVVRGTRVGRTRQEPVFRFELVEDALARREASAADAWFAEDCDQVFSWTDSVTIPAGTRVKLLHSGAGGFLVRLVEPLEGRLAREPFWVARNATSLLEHPPTPEDLVRGAAMRALRDSIWRAYASADLVRRYRSSLHPHLDVVLGRIARQRAKDLLRKGAHVAGGKLGFLGSSEAVFRTPSV